jgi:hypothetical protein
MKLQVLQDNLGNEMGVYLSRNEKKLIEKRLHAIQSNPKRLRPIDELLKKLK